MVAATLFPARTDLVVAGNGKQRANQLLSLPDPLAAQRRSRDGEERRSRLVGNRLTYERFACKFQEKIWQRKKIKKYIYMRRIKST